MEIKYIDIIKTKRTKKIEELFKQSNVKDNVEITVNILEFPLEKVKEYCEKSNNNENLNSEMEEFEKELQTYIKYEYRNLLDDDNNLNEEDEYDDDESLYGDYDNRESNDEYNYDEIDEEMTEKERKSLYCDADCGHCIGCRMAEGYY